MVTRVIGLALLVSSLNVSAAWGDEGELCPKGTVLLGCRVEGKTDRSLVLCSEGEMLVYRFGPAASPELEFRGQFKLNEVGPDSAGFGTVRAEFERGGFLYRIHEEYGPNGSGFDVVIKAGLMVFKPGSGWISPENSVALPVARKAAPKPAAVFWCRDDGAIRGALRNIRQLRNVRNVDDRSVPKVVARDDPAQLVVNGGAARAYPSKEKFLGQEPGDDGPDWKNLRTLTDKRFGEIRVASVCRRDHDRSDESCDIVLAVRQGNVWQIANIESTQDISWGRSPATETFTLKGLSVQDPGWAGAAALFVEYEKRQAVGNESGPPSISREHCVNLYLLQEGKAPALLALQVPIDHLKINLLEDESFEITGGGSKLTEASKRLVGKHRLPAPSF